MRKAILLVATFTLAPAIQSYAQALPFLNYPASTQTLGMGGVGTALISDDAAATIANPAQLGIFSLSGILNAATDLRNSPGSTNYGTAGSLDASALNLGVILNRFWHGLPFKVSAGLGYSLLRYKSQFTLSAAPRPDETIGSSNSLSFALGLDYFIRAGMGFSWKWAKISPPAYSGDAWDIGTILHIPITRFILHSGGRPALENENAEPVFDLSVGYAMRNVGEYASSTFVPLPRQADLGWSVDFAMKSVSHGYLWKWLSFSYSIEANNAPFKTDSTIGTIYGGIDTVWNYYEGYPKGLGNFNPWNNLVLGKASATVGIPKGAQIGLGEFIYIRAGAITDDGQTTYTTFGWGLRLEGLVKSLAFLGWITPRSVVTKFLLDHLDLQYDYSRAYGGIYQGKPSEDLNLVVR